MVTIIIMIITITPTTTGVWRDVNQGVSELAETIVQNALRKKEEANFRVNLFLY